MEKLKKWTFGSLEDHYLIQQRTQEWDKQGASSTGSKLTQFPKSGLDKTSLPSRSAPGQRCSRRSPGHSPRSNPNRNLTRCSNGKASSKVFQLTQPSISNSDQAALGRILPECAAFEAIFEVLESEGSLFPSEWQGRAEEGRIMSWVYCVSAPPRPRPAQNIRAGTWLTEDWNSVSLGVTTAADPKWLSGRMAAAEERERNDSHGGKEANRNTVPPSARGWSSSQLWHAGNGELSKGAVRGWGD